MTQITEIQGDSVGNPQRDTKKLEEEFPPLGTGFSLTVEVKFDVDLKVGLSLIKRLKLKKSIASGENSVSKCTEMSKCELFLDIRSHSVSPVCHELG